nr:hypothetical protein [Bacteroidota bacterium]
MKNFYPFSLLFVLFYLFLTGCINQSGKGELNQFSFAFITDIHLQPERNATEGFVQAIGELNALKPDFVITGGDLIMYALGQTWGRADSLYKL